MKWITFGNKTTSKAGTKYKSTFWIARAPNTNKMTARGNVNATHKVPVKVAFHDPAIVFGKTLADLLRKNGIIVGKVEHVANDASLAEGTVIFTHITPIQTALRRCNTDSHNLYAESLLKRLSAQATKRSGTFDEGSKVIKAIISQRLNEKVRRTVVSDGSGMSRENQISPRTVARWLASFDLDDPAGKSLMQSLATPGNGTLDDRFKNIDLSNATVHAKSGYLQGVCSLSGYISFENRAPLTFSIIVNNVQGTVKGAKTMQERIITSSINSVGQP